MTDTENKPIPDDQLSPGALMRAARERRGMHLAALASAIKVSPARLEALEQDDYSGMPDTTFARALAQAVCRALKTDPAPVLALMPESFHSRLERVDEGINAPFRERPGRMADAGDMALWRQPVSWVVALLLLAAAAFVWWPRTSAGPNVVEILPPGAEAVSALSAAGGLPPAEAASGAVGQLSGAADVQPTSSAAGTPGATDLALPVLAATPAAQGSTAVTTDAPVAPAATAANAVGVRAVQDAWVQVSDASGKVLVARTLPAGESATYSGPLPLKLRLGNVQGTELSFRGQAIDIKGLSKDNTLSLSLPQTGQP